LEFEMANSRKSIVVIQEVQILPRVTASHRPGSETRWQKETNVRSRVNQVDRLCIEPRNGFLRGPNLHIPMGKGIAPFGRLSPRGVNCGQPQPAGTQYPNRRSWRVFFGSHRGRRPGHVDQGMTRELVRASSSPVRRNRGSSQSHSAGVHRDTKAPTGKASTARPILTVNAEKAGTTQRAGWRRRVGWTLGSLS
jgi:hypothetical protein